MQARINNLRKRLSLVGADAMLVTSPSNMRYLTGIDNPDGCILITEKGAYAFQDFRYTEAAEKALSGIYEVIDPKGQLYKHVSAILKNDRARSLAYENLFMSVEGYSILCKSVRVRLKKANDMIRELRSVKSEVEIDYIASAQKIADMAFDHILKMLTPHMTENDVAAELEYFMRKNGAEDKSFDTICVSGKKSSLPHGVPDCTMLRPGFLTMDFGAVVNGYHSDMTRTVCIGKADEEMKRLYSTVLCAQTEALEFIKAGVSCADADRVARDITDRDYAGCFGHSLGHGVGLDIHELPNLSQRSKATLVPGNVVTVEPGIYIPDKYGCRIEDFVLIRENSVENFVKSPKELIEIF